MRTPAKVEKPTSFRLNKQLLSPGLGKVLRDWDAVQAERKVQKEAVANTRTLRSAARKLLRFQFRRKMRVRTSR